MLSLVQIQNDQVVASSRQVAEHFCKDHSHLLRDIRLIISMVQAVNTENQIWSRANVSELFFESSYIDRGVKKPEYLMNRDGFMLLVMGFEGFRAFKWKLA